jgi:hypothetical protein
MEQVRRHYIFMFTAGGTMQINRLVAPKNHFEECTDIFVREINKVCEKLVFVRAESTEIDFTEFGPP